MLDLDALRWGELDHAYGSASDTPALLRMLEANPNVQKFGEVDSEIWRQLYISICHQGTAYSASYAAVPHIMRIASLAADPPALDYLLLPAMIDRGRDWSGSAQIPSDLEESYFQAIRQLPELIPRFAKVVWDEESACAIVGVLLSLCGQQELGEGFEQMRLNDVRLYLKSREEIQHIADVKTWKTWNEFDDKEAP